MIAARLETMKRGDNQHTGGHAKMHVLRSDAAAMLNVSTRSVACQGRARCRDSRAADEQPGYRKLVTSPAAAGDCAMSMRPLPTGRKSARGFVAGGSGISSHSNPRVCFL
jgi:hypothetical protein